MTLPEVTRRGWGLNAPGRILITAPEEMSQHDVCAHLSAELLADEFQRASIAAFDRQHIGHKCRIQLDRNPGARSIPKWSCRTSTMLSGGSTLTSA